MEANEYQIGGNHYAGKYQHWDYVVDTNMPYLLACATKYVTRWDKKNGVEDLRKSIHYLSKAEERGIYMPRSTCISLFFKSIFGGETVEQKIQIKTGIFCFPLRPMEEEIVRAIVEGYYQAAMKLIEEIIDSIECGPGPEYIKG